jgi:uncharacterized membrane protein (GlpM family)
MELLDRYLHAIEFWLPKRQRQDIIAELSEDLRSQIEEKESELGRKLEDRELEAILKRCGSPLTVALRYLPQQYLIGPTLFPIYKFVLAMIVLGCVVPRVLIWFGFLIADPAHSGNLHMENLWMTVVYFAFFTTLAFAVVERSGVKFEDLNTWNPRKLPPARDPNRIPRFNTMFEIAAITVFFVYFVSLFWPRPVIDLYGAKIALAPVWRVFFAGFLVLTAVNYAHAIANLLHPYWTPLRASLRLLTDVLGGVMLCWLLKAHVLVEISAPSLSAPKAIELTNLINALMTRGLPWCIVFVLAIIGVNGYRVVRLWRAHRPGRPNAPAVNDLSNPMVNGN